MFWIVWAKLFQSVGAATKKALSPGVLLVRGFGNSRISSLFDLTVNLLHA